MTSQAGLGLASTLLWIRLGVGGGVNIAAMADLDLEGIRVKFPFLREFSDIFVRSQPLDTLLRMETTSIKVHEFEKSKAASSRLAANRDKISSTFTSVVAGRDNRWDELHSARFLLSAAAAGCLPGMYWGRGA